MTDLSQTVRLFNGAKVSRRPPAPPTPKKIEPEPRMPSDAYLLAMANKHKGWAKRWLRAHRYWL